MPISLARGHIRAGFDINVESTYAIELHFSSDRVLQRHPCPDNSMDCDRVSLAGAPWSVSAGGKPFAGGRGQPDLGDQWEHRSLGAFQCGQGHYVLDIESVEDQSRLNFYEPRLVIFEVGGRKNSDGSLWVAALSLLALVLCGPVGASMSILAAVHWRQEKLVAFWKTCPLTQAGPVPGRIPLVAGKTVPFRRRTPKSALARPFSKPYHLSLTMVLVLMAMCSVMALIYDAEHVVVVGLPIHLIRSGVTAPRSPGIQPLLVRVIGDAYSARLSIDSQSIEWKNLGAVLRKELRQRPPDSPVYVQGDPDLRMALRG
jgi:hypothetical protein